MTVRSSKRARSRSASDAFVAVDGIDFAIEPGEAFGFLGPNGAGKTSTMRMIGCVSPRSGGELRVLGMDPRTTVRAIRGRLGVVPQEDNLDTELTVWDNMMIYGRYFDLPRAGDPRARRRSCSTSCSSPTGATRRSTRCRAA